MIYLLVPTGEILGQYPEVNYQINEYEFDKTKLTLRRVRL